MFSKQERFSLYASSDEIKLTNKISLTSQLLLLDSDEIKIETFTFQDISSKETKRLFQSYSSHLDFENRSIISQTVLRFVQTPEVCNHISIWTKIFLIKFFQG